MADSKVLFSILAYSGLYCILRWGFFPRLVRLYPSMCHGSWKHAERSNKTSNEERLAHVTSHASAVLANRVMGIVMAAMVSALGAYVVWETREDVLLSRSSVLIPGARFHLGYFIVDIYAMFQETKWSFANSNASLSARVTRLLQKKYLFIFHHAVFVLSGLTLLENEFRGGKGDWLIGIVCLFELSTPFLSFHYIQQQMGSQDTLCYQLNGLLFLVVYFVFRIMAVPFIYLVYAYQHHEGNLWKAIISMRLVCHVVTLLGFALLLYWFLEVLQKGARTMVHRRQKLDKSYYSK